MEPIAWLTLIIFSLAIIAVLTNVIEPAVAALLGVGIMVWAGIMTETDAFLFVDWNVMAILVSVWIIAGYFGINAAGDYPGSPGRKALVYGTWIGALVLAITAIAAVIVTIFGDFAYPFLLWGGVVVATFYYSSMSALGAWYAELRAIEKAKVAATPVQTPPRPPR